MTAPAFEFDGQRVWWYHRCRARDVADMGEIGGLLPLRQIEQTVLPRPDGPSWTVTHVEPLTVEPAIHCHRCGTRGRIQGGQWVPAEFAVKNQHAVIEGGFDDIHEAAHAAARYTLEGTEPHWVIESPSGDRIRCGHVGHWDEECPCVEQQLADLVDAAPALDVESEDIAGRIRDENHALTVEHLLEADGR